MELQEVDFLNPLDLNPWLGSLKTEPFQDHTWEEPLKENLWGFSYYSWLQVQKEFGTIERLYGAIQDLKREVKATKEKFRGVAKSFPEVQVEPNVNCGISGSYFLLDSEGVKKYVIKPFDEDAGCIHSLGYSSPFSMSPFRKNMPLYFSSMREVLAYRISQLIGVDGIVPKTEFGIIESEKFHDLSESIFPEERKRFEEICGSPDKEKLSSVQEFVENSKSLFEAIHEFEMAKLSDDEIALRICQTDFEEANLLLWTTYDTDGHMGNFLVYPKRVDEVGNEILGLKKIDNGLAFPEKNRQFHNTLAFLPNAKNELSMEAKEKVRLIDPDMLQKEFERVRMESAIPAMRERIAYLKGLVQKERITIKEINKEMSKLGKKG